MGSDKTLVCFSLAIISQLARWLGKEAARKGWGKKKVTTIRCQIGQKKLKLWTDKLMEEAMEAILSGRMRVNRAADMYRIPCMILKDRMSGRVKHGTNPGPPLYLTRKEEAAFLIESSSISLKRSH